ncbi:hypothetical protein ACFOEE_00330 [Pseudoalteromonas fenneropenaei]|uniref:Uncharacterized protein n=1 Tax=Pseudoalteromonas fenneropenaei TaxID=1737459 RepID=A0ABV7CEV9_9GAMM
MQLKLKKNNLKSLSHQAVLANKLTPQIAGGIPTDMTGQAGISCRACPVEPMLQA